MSTKLVSVILVCLVLGIGLLACGGLGGEESPAPEVPTPQKNGEGRCGDGVCDGPENVQNCPEDCSVIALPEDSTQQGERAHVSMSWTSSYGCSSGQQVDDLYADFEFSWSVSEEGEITGSGEGTMSSEPVSRCPDTDYGGLKTPDPFPVTVSGFVDEGVSKITLAATDTSQAYLTNGSVYRTECVLCWVMPEFKGTDISGTLASFSIPASATGDSVFTFKMNYIIESNVHEGEGLLEILEKSQ
jgi:hypothetical protein